MRVTMLVTRVCCFEVEVEPQHGHFTHASELRALAIEQIEAGAEPSETDYETEFKKGSTRED